MNRLFIVLFASFIPLVSLAHDGEEHEGIPWPPDPRGITNVVVHSDAALERSVENVSTARVDALEQKVKQDPRVTRALGKKYNRVGLIDKETKNGKLGKFIYFSRDKNSTVEVELANDNVQTVKSIPAKDYQPEITPEEALEAEDLARKYFIKKGFTNVSNLQGYGILAYKPSNNGFYNTRVIYVSFHDNDDSPPEFVAWVDLTNQRILKAREEK